MSIGPPAPPSLADLLATAAKMVGWRYSLTDPRYPEPLPGVVLPLAPFRQTNCCAFVEAVVVGAAARGGFAGWAIALHRKAMAIGTLWPTDAYADAGIARAWTGAAAPEVPCVLQGWHRAFPSGEPDPAGGGHTMLYLAHDAPSGRVLVLEANTAASGLDGPGWRGFGRLSGAELPEAGTAEARALGCPAGGWRADPRAWTWERFATAFPLRRFAALDLRAASVPVALRA